VKAAAALSSDEAPLPPWRAWYRAAREEAAFRYGLRGIPVDEYKTEWLVCASGTVQEAVRNIAKRRGLA
jgi:hypothetical protein